jgi:DNA-binding transcriptional MerR regulator
MAEQQDSGLITTGDLARHFGVSRETIRQWEVAGELPPASRLGKQRFWRAIDLPFIARLVEQRSGRRERRAA